MSRCQRRGLRTPCDLPVVPGRKLCAYHLKLKAGVMTPRHTVTRAGGVPSPSEEKKM